MRWMALDIGTKKVGIALTDPALQVVQPYDTIYYKNKTELREKIRSIIGELDVSRLIVGLPLDTEGNDTPQSMKIRKLGNFLQACLPKNLEWDMQHEILTSYEAEEMLLEFDVSRKKRRKVIDKLAASNILQGYLDKKNREGNV